MLNAKVFRTKCKQTPATMTGDFCGHHCIVFLFGWTSFDLIFYPSRPRVKLVTKWPEFAHLILTKWMINQHFTLCPWEYQMAIQSWKAIYKAWKEKYHRIRKCTSLCHSTTVCTWTDGGEMPCKILPPLS